MNSPVFIKEGFIKNPIILFDHNGGGGTNTYTQSIVKKMNASGNSVLRVYFFDGLWFVHWIDVCDGMSFFTNSIEELFDALFLTHASNVIVNSIYGHPDIEKTISKIIDLKQLLKSNLEVKVHDFHAICPSPHLMDFEEKYCGVPEDKNICNQCLKKNLGWYHNWYPLEKRATNILEWRKPFNYLFQQANTITFFDDSAKDILGKGFRIKQEKINCSPHDSDYFHCDKKIDISGDLHIATLGTLSVAKGGNIVNEIYRHILLKNLKIPLTILGANLVDLVNGINVYGAYDTNDLPKIIKEKNINMIFIPSIIPETFSYTISEAIKMGLPIVSFDIGAQGNRLKHYALGKTIPINSPPSVILDAIKSHFKEVKRNQC